ncbi:GNAT family protein [Actinophytocola sp.]|uniref:GNAT family N-acetyltransferase n=1 Tax=Actinophytocola sp. TaxID=1872138 RepID=UPI002ED28021
MHRAKVCAMSLTARPIATERLLLRPFTMDDLDDVWAYQRLPQVAQYMLWAARDREESRVSLEQMVSENGLTDDGDYLTLAVSVTGTSTVIGHVELGLVSLENLQGEIGYVFHPDSHGKGFATEATRQMLRLGFEEMGLHRITGRCSAQNTASAKLMTRLGMRQEAHFVDCRRVDGEWREELVFAILRREWLTT